MFSCSLFRSPFPSLHPLLEHFRNVILQFYIGFTSLFHVEIVFYVNACCGIVFIPKYTDRKLYVCVCVCMSNPVQILKPWQLAVYTYLKMRLHSDMYSFRIRSKCDVCILFRFLRIRLVLLVSFAIRFA